MSEENVELVYRSVDAVNRRDLDALLALMDENVESVPQIVAIQGGLHGHDGVRHWWHDWFDTFPDFQLEVVETRDMGEAVVATVRALGHGAGSAVPVEDKVWQATRWQNSKCVWWQIFRAETEALEAAGLSE